MPVHSLFEIRVTTIETRSILRASTEREVVNKAEFLIRRVHARGEMVGFSIAGPDRAAIGRIEGYLVDVMAEVGRVGL
jgi:hypothetical protein